MDAVEFYKAFKRMCDKTDCKDCLLDQKCRPSANVEPEEVVELVEEWAKDHPAKTRQSEFLKMFPHAQKRDGIINICPLSVDKDHKTNSECLKTACDACRNRFWNEEVTDND